MTCCSNALFGFIGLRRELLLAGKSFLAVLNVEKGAKCLPSMLRLFPSSTLSKCSSLHDQHSLTQLTRFPTLESIESRWCASMPDSVPGSTRTKQVGWNGEYPPWEGAALSKTLDSRSAVYRESVVRSFESVYEEIMSDAAVLRESCKRKQDSLAFGDDILSSTAGAASHAWGKRKKHCGVATGQHHTRECVVERVEVKKCYISDLRLCSINCLSHIANCQCDCTDTSVVGVTAGSLETSSISYPSSVLDLLITSPTAPPQWSLVPPPLSSVTYKPLLITLVDASAAVIRPIRARIDNECMTRLLGNIPAALVWHCAKKKSVLGPVRPNTLSEVNIVDYDYAAAAYRVYCALHQSVTWCISDHGSNYSAKHLFDVELQIRRTTDSPCELFLGAIREILE